MSGAPLRAVPGGGRRVGLARARWSAPGSRPHPGADHTLDDHHPDAGRSPLEALALATACGVSSREARLIDSLAVDARRSTPARASARRWHRAADARLLLVVDQFEEVFTLSRDEAEPRGFLDNLLTAIGGEGPVSAGAHI